MPVRGPILENAVLIDTLIGFLGAGLADATWGEMLAYTLITTHITIASVTIFLHRAQAHRALDLHPAVAHFFRLWLWLTTGMVTREWVAIHRKHHAKCETVEDPHSPITRGLKTVLSRGSELYRTEAKNQETLAKYGHGTPDDWIERRLYSRFSWQGVGLTLIVDVLLFGVIGLAIWAVQMLWIPITAAGIINGIGHYWGYRNFESPDRATNILPIGLLIGGEELHNNHHTYASSARLSNKWWEFDIGWFYIRTLALLGLARVRKVAPQPRFVAQRAAIDLQTVQAVIANRYDLMARYAKSLKRAYGEERARLPALAAERLAAAKRWLHLEAARVPETARVHLSEALAHSRALRTLYEMREELAKIWERSNLNTEQLLAHLQAWCAKAESSGVEALVAMSRRIRSYA